MKNEFNKISFKYKRKSHFISVVIPVYNDPEGIGDTLESLKNQNFVKEQYEIIVSNDGGDKETEKICKKYKVKVINIVPNKGSYNARNVALKESKGEYIAFVDADIKVSRNWLREGFNFLKKYDYIGGPVDIDESKLKTLAHYYEYLTAFDNKKKLKKYNYIPTANLMVKREVIESLGGFDSRLWSGGDNEFGDRVFRAKKYEMYFLEDLLVIHPPRGKEALIKKSVRVRQGLISLAKLYPNRFYGSNSTLLMFIKAPVVPVAKVCFSKRRVAFRKRLMLLFLGFYLGFADLINLIRFRNK